MQAWLKVGAQGGTCGVQGLGFRALGLGFYKGPFKVIYRDSIRVQGLGPTWRFKGSYKGPFKGIYRD